MLIGITFESCNMYSSIIAIQLWEVGDSTSNFFVLLDCLCIVAENDFVAAADNLNVQDQLREVLSELRDQREQVQSLKEELKCCIRSEEVEKRKRRGLEISRK